MLWLRLSTRLIQRYFLEHIYLLQLASAVTLKTDAMSQDWAKLYEELDRIKNSALFSAPFGALPIVRKEKISALHVTGFDKFTGDELSTESIFKRAYPDAAEALSYNLNIEKQAFIHIDGNSMRITLAKIVSSRPDYPSESKIQRRISECIQRKINEALSAAEKHLQDRMTHDGVPLSGNYLRISGGDDVNVFCHADYALDFVEAFVREISRTPSGMTKETA